MNRHIVKGMVVLAVTLGAGTAHTATSPEDKCQAERAKAAGTCAACEQQAVAKYYTSKQAEADFSKLEAALSKCRVKYTSTWAKLQAKAALAGSSCTAPRFVDNGNGTVSDNLTGLVWKQKTNLDYTVNLADRHDADNHYTWCLDANADSTCDNGGVADGPAFTDFLRSLNSGACFAGSCDWRLPTRDELQTLFADPWVADPANPPLGVPCATPSCIDAVFGPTQSEPYWSATTYAFGPLHAWAAIFNFGGFTSYGPKTLTNPYVRAVRGGL